jgi:hypothetical protein
MIISECWNCGEKLYEEDDTEEIIESQEMNFCNATCADSWLFGDEEGYTA